LEDLDIEQWRHIREKMNESHPDGEGPYPIIDIKDPPKKEDKEESKKD
jgi:hypothetical protein